MSFYERNKTLVWGLIVLIPLFTLINLFPYISKGGASSGILEVTLVAVTREDGSRVDLFEKGGVLGRELARKVVSAFDIQRTADEEEEPEIFQVEVLLENTQNSRIHLLDGEYTLYIANTATAKGKFATNEPLLIPGKQNVRVWIPMILEIEASQFGTLLRENMKGEVRGQVWIPRGGYKVRIDFSHHINLSNLDL